jgi:hypothetical protein
MIMGSEVAAVTPVIFKKLSLCDRRLVVRVLELLKSELIWLKTDAALLVADTCCEITVISDVTTTEDPDRPLCGI